MRQSITTFTLIILALLVSVIIAQNGGDPTGQTLAENGASTDSPTGQPGTGGTTQNMGSTGNTNQNSGTNGPTDGGQMTESSTAMMQTTGEQYTTTMMPVMTTTMMPVVATTMAPMTSTLMMTTMPASTARPTVAMTTTQKNHGVTVYPHQYLLAFFVALLLIL